MPEMIAFSPATWILLFRQFRRLGTVADGGRQALEIQWDFASSRRAPARPESPQKSRGSVTYRQLRCNMTKRPHGVGVFADRQPLRERPAPVLHKLSLLSACRTPPTCHAPPRIKLPTRQPASCWLR